MTVTSYKNAIGQVNVLFFDDGSKKVVLKKLGLNEDESLDQWVTLRNVCADKYNGEVEGLTQANIMSLYSAVACYTYSTDQTEDSDGHKERGDCTSSYVSHASYYVYALIDPTNPDCQDMSPFYVGKGIYRRALEHESMIGVDEKEMLEGLDNDPRFNKQNTILAIKRKDPEAVLARVVARELTEKVAFTLESFLIRFVYGDGLSNIQPGHHMDRFRPAGDWSHRAGFDLDIKPNGDLKNYAQDDYYVYALINPRDNSVFYVGKGSSGRLMQHFRTSDVEEHEKVSRINELLNDKLKPNQIGRIIARGLTKEEAYHIESLCIRFVFGYDNLTNVQPGRKSGLFRAYGDWTLRHGFDIPSVFQYRAARVDLRDQFLASGLDTLLSQFAEKMPDLSFTEPEVSGAGEFSMAANIPRVNYKGAPINLWIKIQVRNNGLFGVGLDPLSKKDDQKVWIAMMVDQRKYPIHRLDGRFWPKSWINDTVKSPAEAVERAQILIDFVRNPSASPDLDLIYDGLPNCDYIKFLLRMIGRNELTTSYQQQAENLIDNLIDNRRFVLFTDEEMATIEALRINRESTHVDGYGKTKISHAINRAVRQIETIRTARTF